MHRLGYGPSIEPDRAQGLLRFSIDRFDGRGFGEQRELEVGPD
jgi:hypothetical protein